MRFQFSGAAIFRKRWPFVFVSMDVVLTTRSGQEIRTRCISRPTDQQQILKKTLPQAALENNPKRKCRALSNLETGVALQSENLSRGATERRRRAAPRLAQPQVFALTKQS